MPQITRRTFLRASAGAAAALYVGGCGSSSTQSGTVRLPGGTFGFPTPFAYIAGLGYEQMSYIYDTLLWKDASGRLIPWLARKVRRSDDGRTYMFELREGVKWHDGRPFTAEDVVFTFDYFADQPLGPLVTAQPRGVSGARARSRLVVEVELEAPAVTFLEQVASAVPIVPKHVWSKIEDAPLTQSRKVLVGTGPYRLRSYSAGEGAYQYEANNGFFLGKPFIKRIELRPVDDQLSALRAGEIDSASTPPEGVGRDALGPFRGDEFGILGSPATFTFPLIWNIAKGGALADVRFRRASAMAIDRQAIVNRLIAGQGSPGNPGFIPPKHPFHVPVEQYPFDPAAANRLLDRAGYERGSGGVRRGPDGKQLRYTLVTGNVPVPPMLDMLVAAMKEIGVELKPQAVDLPTLFSRLEAGDNEIALSLYPGPGPTALNSDPDYMRTFYSSRVKDRLQGAQGWVNHEFDRLADRQLVTADRQERMRLVARMQHIVADELPVLPLYYPTLFDAFRKEAFDQWYYTPGGFAGGLPGVYNKQALVTGRKVGLEVRSS